MTSFIYDRTTKTFIYTDHNTNTVHKYTAKHSDKDLVCANCGVEKDLNNLRIRNFCKRGFKKSYFTICTHCLLKAAHNNMDFKDRLIYFDKRGEVIEVFN